MPRRRRRRAEESRAPAVRCGKTPSDREEKRPSFSNRIALPSMPKARRATLLRQGLGGPWKIFLGAWCVASTVDAPMDPTRER
jgi:hypothetical protein